MIGGIVAAVLVTGVAIMAGQSALRTWTRDRADTRRTLAAIRWWHLLAALATFGAVVALFLVLVQVPGLDIGWWMLLGGTGNLLLGQTRYDGTGWRLAALAVPLAFAVAVPREALGEENAFRRGCEDWSWPKRALGCVLFGLGHCIMGIPIAAGLALSLAGAAYMGLYLRAHRRAAARWQQRFDGYRVKVEPGSWTPEQVGRYLARHDAMHASAAAHTVYNWLLLAVLMVVLLTVGR